jgi:hypothetical protein
VRIPRCIMYKKTVIRRNIGVAKEGVSTKSCMESDQTARDRVLSE